MTRKLFTTTLVAGIALLVWAPGARCDDKNQQSASNAASTQSSASDQQKSATDNASSTQTSNQNNTSASSNTSANAGTSSQSNQNDTSASANNSTNASSSDTSKNNQSGSTASPALPAPSNDKAQSDSNRTQDQSASRDNDKSNQSRTSSQDRSSDNQARSDQRDNQARSDQRDNQARSDQRDNEARSDQRDNRSNDRDRNQRDVKAGIQVGRASSRGITVDRVPRGSVFYNSGLRDGDVIISYHGRHIRNRDDFDRYVVYERGGRIPVVVWRDGRERTIYITYGDDNGERSYISSDRNHGAFFGAEFDPQITDAAIVVRVEEGSPADRAGLKRDDHVMSLNGKKVASGKEANEVVASMKPGDRVDIEYSRHARTEAVLSGGQDREVARRTSDDQVERSSYESSDSNDARRYDTNRDSNYRGNNNGSQQNRGIFGRRR